MWKSLLALEKGKSQGSVDSTNSQRKDLEAGLGRPLRVDLLKQMTPCGKRISHSAAWGPSFHAGTFAFGSAGSNLVVPVGFTLWPPCSLSSPGRVGKSIVPWCVLLPQELWGFTALWFSPEFFCASRSHAPSLLTDWSHRKTQKLPSLLAPPVSQCGCKADH